jgi:uncharacterized repeat protein (TIGR03803 family)
VLDCDLNHTDDAAGFDRRLPAGHAATNRRRRRLLAPVSRRLASALAIAFVYWGCADAAPKLNVLYSFSNVRGADPEGLIADAAGNLYGTATNGGKHFEGVVFELSPPLAGARRWTETVLFSFRGADDGGSPSASLLMDSAGDLYGTTASGGLNDDGVVFELSPPQAGAKAWTETVLVSFDGADGESPFGPLIADGAGNLFGTTPFGGAHDDGVVFELSPPANGGMAWTQTVLLSFSGPDGGLPYGGVIADGAGNLYGTTSTGGSVDKPCKNLGCGLVFELSPPANGGTAWAQTVLLTFDGANGWRPDAGLISDGIGNLYGTTALSGLKTKPCGGHGCGIAFELSPPAGGQGTWVETVLQSFDGTHGDHPAAPLTLGATGDLYGTTAAGGADDHGVVFELKPPKPGKTAWTETVLHVFDGIDGANPLGALIGDGAGGLYGAAFEGGKNGVGVAFGLTP